MVLNLKKWETITDMSVIYIKPNFCFGDATNNTKISCMPKIWNENWNTFYDIDYKHVLKILDFKSNLFQTSRFNTMYLLFESWATFDSEISSLLISI